MRLSEIISNKSFYLTPETNVFKGQGHISWLWLISHALKLLFFRSQTQYIFIKTFLCRQNFIEMLAQALSVSELTVPLFHFLFQQHIKCQHFTYKTNEFCLIFIKWSFSSFTGSCEILIHLYWDLCTRCISAIRERISIFPKKTSLFCHFLKLEV